LPFLVSSRRCKIDSTPNNRCMRCRRSRVSLLPANLPIPPIDFRPEIAQAYHSDAYSMGAIATHFKVSRMTVGRAVKRFESPSARPDPERGRVTIGLACAANRKASHRRLPADDPRTLEITAFLVAIPCHGEYGACH
jgi:hypothetical protein